MQRLLLKHNLLCDYKGYECKQAFFFIYTKCIHSFSLQISWNTRFFESVGEYSRIVISKSLSILDKLVVDKKDYVDVAANI